MKTLERVGQGLALFKHKRLDPSNPKAIRLLRVLPHLSSSGLIQCEIIHDNTDTKFACLSYVWGDAISQEAISIINEDGLESILVVRRNLWDFLNVARSKFSDLSRSKVDAQLEADSEEDERNQQVQMMGDMYRGRTVLAWLGCDKEIESFMVAFGQSWELVYFRQVERLGLRKSYTDQASDGMGSLKSLGGQNFSTNEYWNRA
ncbi:hypothetical protein BKA63DRAFT_417941 [Paraphoma chrysanthemicola]|nr:hypothetical protein BKA63DRAFT_417941 [Paraphoma chrysanthemicola]